MIVAHISHPFPPTCSKVIVMRVMKLTEASVKVETFKALYWTGAAFRYWVFGVWTFTILEELNDFLGKI